jgi:hypothetical protein
MIVQVRRDALRVIRQLDHALAAGRLALAWIPEIPFRVAWGAALHDLAWAEEDREPVYDEATKSIVTFQTIDAARREHVYSSGIDRLRALDEAAAALAGMHYSRFVPELSTEGAGTPASANRRADAALVRHLDDLSLFVCLACPDALNRPDWLTEERVAARPDGGPHSLRWVGPDTLSIRPFPLDRPLTLRIPCRDLPRRSYASAIELRDAWNATTPAEHRVRLIAA